MTPRYLTKSRFQLALDCPAKLFYEGKREYANNDLEDAFLQSLAEGGFQVGALARCYFPGGSHIETLDEEEALKQTGDLLKQDKVIIYEAAVRYDNYFIRIDILVKDGNHIDLVEVKAKSFDPDKDSFIGRRGGILADWRGYLSDVAFQKFILSQAYPECTVSAYLMLVDKTAVCPADGLNQKFKVISRNGRKAVSVAALSPEDLAVKILTQVNVDDCCDLIYNQPVENGAFTGSFTDYAAFLAEQYAADRKIVSPVTSSCKTCQFNATDDELKSGLRSGFRECWSECLGWCDDDFNEPTVLDIWSYRKKNDCIEAGRIRMCDITEDDIILKEDSKPGISSSQRQWLQVEKVRNKDTSCWVDRENLKREMDSWMYPLHFIDFETSAVAIPFNKDRHPYEGIAFQFSHHTVEQDGKIKHKGQFLDVTPGVFPNYDFMRSLRDELYQDEGSIFMYSPHENRFFNIIYRQLMEDEREIPDREELCEFIKTIAVPAKDQEVKWNPERTMIDMLELVKRYYYDPAMKGSNSIKKVLPAILNGSDYLQEKYSKPVYGAENGIPSLNYRDWQWIKVENGVVADPYKLLPKLFTDVSEKDLVLLSEDNELRDGGAALTAYARLQFEEMSDYEREEIKQALLKYCELDTLAMVMIYEGWREMVDEKY